MCYNATETRVREITRHRVKQIILLSHRVFSAEVPEIRPLVSETRLFFRTTESLTASGTAFLVDLHTTWLTRSALSN